MEAEPAAPASEIVLPSFTLPGCYWPSVFWNSLSFLVWDLSEINDLDKLEIVLTEIGTQYEDDLRN